MTEEVSYGSKVYDDNGVLLGYEAGKTDEGFIYKDEEAFLNCPDEICYIAEHAFEGDYMTVEEAKTKGETHNTIVEQCRDVWGEEYMMTDEQLEYFAKDVFGLAEWACIDTYLTENFCIEDCIDFEGIKGTGIFTQFQIEAVMNGMTPLEWKKFNTKN